MKWWPWPQKKTKPIDPTPTKIGHSLLTMEGGVNDGEITLDLSQVRAVTRIGNDIYISYIGLLTSNEPSLSHSDRDNALTHRREIVAAWLKYKDKTGEN